eukprot:2752663-Prymnesium_polylepis.4
MPCSKDGCAHSGRETERQDQCRREAFDQPVRKCLSKFQLALAAVFDGHSSVAEGVNKWDGNNSKQRAEASEK